MSAQREKKTQRISAAQPGSAGALVKPVVTSIVVGGIVCTILLLLLSVLLSARNIPQSLINPMAVFAISLGALSAGFCCAKILRRAGLALGALSGGAFCIVVMLASLGVSDNGFGLTALFKVVFIMICAMIGGVMGVNTRSRRRR